jgi:translation initiation factor 3 subunit A
MQDRDPLNLCKTIAPYLAKLEKQVVQLSAGAPVRIVDHDQHVFALKAVAVLKMMRQLASAYSIMRIDKAAALIPFMSFSEVEAVLADAVKYGYVDIQIDHRSSTLHFNGAQLRNDSMANHLSTIVVRLAGAMTLIKPGELQEKQAERRRETAKAVRATASQLNEELLARKVLIERRKEAREREREEAEREEEEKRRKEQVLLHVLPAYCALVQSRGIRHLLCVSPRWPENKFAPKWALLLSLIYSSLNRVCWNAEGGKIEQVPVWDT